MKTVISCLYYIHRKEFDTGADNEPLVIILGLTKIDRCRRIRLGGAYDGESQVVDYVLR